MPIYEYRCEHGHTFEVMQRMTDDPVSVCSTCDAPVERVFHPVAVHFKGSGFYTTDYGRKRSRDSSDSDSSTDSKSEGKSDSKSESSSGSESEKKSESKTAASSSSD